MLQRGVVALSLLPGVLEDRWTGQIAGHHHHGVAEIHGPPLGIGEPAIVEDLQQQVEHIGMGFLDLIQQQHRVGAPSHRFRQLTTLLVAHISRRRTDQSRHSVALHELTHIEPHQGFVFIEQGRRQGLGQFGLADAGGAKEQKRSHRPPRILHPRPRPTDRRRHSGHRL